MVPADSVGAPIGTSLHHFEAQGGNGLAGIEALRAAVFGAASANSDGSEAAQLKDIVQRKPE